MELERDKTSKDYAEKYAKLAKAKAELDVLSAQYKSLLAKPEETGSEMSLRYYLVSSATSVFMVAHVHTDFLIVHELQA